MYPAKSTFSTTVAPTARPANSPICETKYHRVHGFPLLIFLYCFRAMRQPACSQNCLKKWSYCSVVRGHSGDDEHEVEGDDEFERHRLRVRTRRRRPEEVLVPAAERQAQRQARQRGSQHLSQYIGRHLQTSALSVFRTGYSVSDQITFIPLNIDPYTCFHGKRRQVAKATVTAGLKCAPETWPTE